MIEVRPPAGRASKWSIGRDDAPLRFQVNPDDGEAVTRIAKKLACEPAEILEAVEAARVEAIPEPPPPVTDEPTVTAAYRDHRPGSQEYPSIAAYLADARAGGCDWTDLRWSDIDRLAALDIDLVTKGNGWTELDMPEFLSTPGPRPRYAWVTKSGGLRFIYGPCARYGLTARQRAGLAALLLEPGHHVKTKHSEVLACTAAPRPGARVWSSSPTDEYTVADLRGALTRTGGSESASQEGIEAWLAEHGMRVGERYPHDLCPTDPGPSTGTDPIKVFPDGIRCWKGGCPGGFRPWSALIAAQGVGSALPPLILAALEQVHWVHARLILQASRPTAGPTGDHIRRSGYEALLRVLHPDADTASVWRSDLQFVRGDGGWLHSDTLTSYTKIGPASIAALPWVGDSGPRRDRALSDAELKGYVRVEPVLWLTDAPAWEAGRVTVPLPVETGVTGLSYTLEAAWDQMREALPGIPDEWLRLTRALTVAALLGQSAGHTPPITIIHGPSGSGKGAAVQFVSGILGVGHGALNFSDETEMSRSLGESLERRCPQVFGDEVGKARSWFSLSASLLKASTYVGWRKLFVGNVLTRNRTSIVLAGSTMPPGLLTMRELRRRASYCRLPRIDPAQTAEWDGALADGLQVVDLDRLRGSSIGAAVANAYIADAKEVYARANAEGLRKWPLLAHSLGLEVLGDSEETLEIQSVIRELYHLWMTAGPEHFLDERTGRRGWLRCYPAGHHDEGAAALTSWLCPDDPDPVQDAKVGRITTEDCVIACGLGADAQVALELQRRGRHWVARFTTHGSRTFERAAFPEPVVD